MNIPGCVWPFESWCVRFVYIPGCVWNFMSGFLFFMNWLTPLKLTLKKCRISSQILQKFSSFLEWFVVFVEDDAAKGLLLETLIWWNLRQNDKKKFGKDLFAFRIGKHVLILTPGVIQTPLWRTFDGGSSEVSMDDREVDSR